MQNLSPAKIIKYQLYLLQLENYELGRYFGLLWKKGLWPRGEQRKELVWTKKARALMVMAVGLDALAAVVVFYWGMQSSVLVGGLLWLLLIVLFFCYFIFFSLALVMLMPLDSLAKKSIVAKAKSKLESFVKLSPGPSPRARGGCMTIGIAGSYGKTTMKEVLTQVLSAKFLVLSTPESVNTPVGIARWILNKVTEETEIIIVEMGEHYQNDIKDICDIVRPDIAVVTGINESHLERMKNMDTVVATVFEIVSNAKPSALIVLNGDDEKVISNYKKFVWPDHQVIKFQVASCKSKQFSPEKLSWTCKLEDLDELEVGLLGEYSLGDVDAAVKIAKSLGMSDADIIAGIKNIKPVEHRLQPIKSGGEVLVIDDSYNGNPAGVAEAIKVLSRFTNRRKVYITPGLVEMGRVSEAVHREIGRQLAGVADVVILVKNSVTPFIAEGISTTPSAARPPLLKEGGKTAREPAKSAQLRSLSSFFKEEYPATQGEVVEKPEIIWFNTALEAHAGLKNILKPGDVVIFQNDWGDQYL